MPSAGQTPGYLLNFAPFSDKSSFEVMHNMIPRIEGEKIMIVDAMAGIGLVGRNIAQLLQEKRQQTAEIIYVDLNEEMLAFPTFKPDDYRVAADIKEIPVHDGIADVLTCRCGLNNLTEPEWEIVVKEFLRVTRIGGTIVIQDHLPLTDKQRVEMDAIEEFIAIMDKRPNIPKLKTLEELDDFFDRYGGLQINRQTVRYQFDIRKRLASKGIFTDCIQSSEVVYPVSTIAYQKVR